MLELGQKELVWMSDEVGIALGIFVLRILGNTITTLRLVMLARGRSGITFALSFLESTVFAVALGAVVQNLTYIPNLVAYSLGFAIGSSAGIWLERKLTLGYVKLSVISRQQGHEVANSIREAGFGATELDGHGVEGNVFVVETVVERHHIASCVQAIQKTDPHAFITTQALQSTYRGYIPAIQPSLARLLNRN
jgi:uncharacterized protein YebE (UPF0316 family)